jgi:hypothetical protein
MPLEHAGQHHRSAAASSVYALLKRIRLRLPLAPNGVNIGFRMESPLRGLAAGVRHEVRLPDDRIRVARAFP